MKGAREAAQPASGQRAGAFLPRIEALRGFAALAVAWGHATAVVNFADGHPAQGLAHLRGAIHMSVWAANAQAAVIVFFVISGLVLGLMLDSQGKAGAIRGYFAFLVRRALRIYPAHWTALLLFLPLAAFILFRIPAADPGFVASLPANPRWWFDGTIYGHVSRWEIVRTAALYNEYCNAVTWSLRVEMQACLVVPLLVWITRRGSLAMDLGALAGLIGLATLVDPAVRPDHVFLYLPAFHLGAIAGTRGRAIAAALARRRGATVGSLVLAYVVLMLPAALARYPDVRLWMVLDMSAGAFGLVVLVAWARHGRLDKLFLHPVSRWIGRHSYSFYLWHWLVLVAAIRVLLIMLPGTLVLGPANPFLFFAIAITTISIALGIAALSYRWVERPFMILGRSVAERIIAGRRSGSDVPLAAETLTAP